MGYTNFPNGITSMGVPVTGGLGLGPGDVRYVIDAKTTSDLYYTKLLERAIKDEMIFTALQTAHDACTSSQNDIIVMAPQNESLAAAFTWSKSHIHLVSMSPLVNAYHPTYISHTVNTDVLFTISGSYNSFTNIRWLHGYNSATNAHCIELTGMGNNFYNCHFEGPEGAAEKAVSGYDLVKVSEEYNFFKNCVFGNTWAAMTDVSALVGFTGNKNVSTTFEDCLFQKNFGATSGLFLHTYQSPNGGSIISFKNCQFINTGASTPQYAIDGYGMNTNRCIMTFLNCSFNGATDICAATYEPYMWFNTGQMHSTAGTDNILNVGLGSNPDAA